MENQLPYIIWKILQKWSTPTEQVSLLCSCRFFCFALSYLCLRRSCFLKLEANFCAASTALWHRQQVADILKPSSCTCCIKRCRWLSLLSANCLWNWMFYFHFQNFVSLQTERVKHDLDFSANFASVLP